MAERPLAIDLFAGLGGWTEALMAAGWRVVGFDIERHRYPDGRGYPAQLVLQDVLTLHGRQFRDASLIVASPPCQAYSYMAMPWKLAKAKRERYLAQPELIENELNVLFRACFRIQREACEAAGRHIPMVVENVRGAQPWVGRSVYNYGSFHLWGDVPALMPFPRKHMKNGSGGSWFARNPNGTPGALNNARDGLKFPEGNNSQRKWCDRKVKRLGDSPVNHPGHALDGTKGSGSWFGTYAGKLDGCPTRKYSSKSTARKLASALIAKIPEPLARHIAQVYYPR